MLPLEDIAAALTGHYPTLEYQVPNLGEMSLPTLYEILGDYEQNENATLIVREILTRLLSLDNEQKEDTTTKLGDIMTQCTFLLRGHDAHISYADESLNEEVDFQQVQTFESIKDELLKEKAALLFVMNMLLEIYKITLQAHDDRNGCRVALEMKVGRIDALKRRQRETIAFLERLSAETCLKGRHNSLVEPIISNDLQDLVKRVDTVRIGTLMWAQRIFLAAESTLNDQSIKNPLGVLIKIFQLEKQAILHAIADIEELKELARLTDSGTGPSSDYLLSLEGKLKEEMAELDIKVREKPKYPPVLTVVGDIPNEKYLEQAFDGLNESYREYSGKVYIWKEIINAMPNREAFIQGLESLKNPIIHGLNDRGELMIGNGFYEESEDYDYIRNLETCVAYSYDGKLGRSPNKSNMQKDAQIFWEKGLMTYDELSMLLNRGGLGTNIDIWLENGNVPLSINVQDIGISINNDPRSSTKKASVYSILRVKLNLPINNSQTV